MYEAVRVSVPAASEPFGMVKLAEPEMSATGQEVKLPLDTITVPLGVLPEPETAIVIPRPSATLILLAAGDTVTVGVVFSTLSDVLADAGATLVGSFGVNVTFNFWFPAPRTVPKAGEYVNVPG